MCEACHRLLLGAVTMADFLGHILHTGGRIQGSALPSWYKTILKDTHTSGLQDSFNARLKYMTPTPQVFRNTFMRWWCETVMWGVTDQSAAPVFRADMVCGLNILQ